jgi:hypothetical protein
MHAAAHTKAQLISELTHTHTHTHTPFFSPKDMRQEMLLLSTKSERSDHIWRFKPLPGVSAASKACQRSQHLDRALTSTEPS